jgi:hypothetical protein
MDRISKLIVVVGVLSALASCGIFFTPMEGRWNTADPKNELLTFNPSLDGYVEEGATWNDNTVLYAYPPPPSGIKAALLRFDTADFPRVVAASYLQLTATSKLSAGQVLYFYRIIRDWDPGRITYDDVISGDFYDESLVTIFSVPGDVSDIQIPLGDVFIGNRDDLADGIVMFSPDSLVFHSSEPVTTGTPPLLLVEPE